MSVNPFHDVSVGDKTPYEFNAIVEIPRGSHNKYEIDKETGLIALDRVNYSSAPYPVDYAFAPQTLWDDGDALDVLVLTTYPLYPGVLVAVRPVAVMKMIDSGESDYKILAVPVSDKRWDDVKDLSDLNKHNLKEYQHFFETYKVLKGKGDVVTIEGYGDKKEAEAAVLKSIALYKEKYGKKA